MNEMRKEDENLWRTVFLKMLKAKNIHIAEEDYVKPPNDSEVSRPIRRLRLTSRKRSSK